MLKRIKRAGCLAAALLMISSTVNASAIDAAQQDYDTQIVTVKGILGAEYAKQTGMLCIGAEIDTDKVEYFDYITLDDEGKYDVCVKLRPGATGKLMYKVKFFGNGLESDEKSFAYYSAGDTANMLDSLENAESVDAVKNVVDEYRYMFFGEKTDLYNDMLKNSADVSYVINKILCGKPYVTAAQCYAAANGELLINYANTVSDTDSMLEFIDKYGDVIGIKKQPLYVKYFDSKSENCISAEKINNVMQVMCDIAQDKSVAYADTYESICKRFNEAVMLSFIKYSALHTEVEEYINMFFGNLNIDTTAYNSLKDSYKTSVRQKLINGDYHTKEKLKDVFDGAVAAYENENQGGGVGGSSKRGGGASGGNVSVNGISQLNPPAPVVKSESFTDLAGYEWAKDAIEFLVSEKIVNGVGNNKFAPQEYVTREQFVKMLLEAMNISTDGDLQCSLADVDKNGWYYKYIATAQKEGIVTSKSANTFGLGDPITREELAAMAYRAVKDKVDRSGISVANITFSDNKDISDYALDASAFMCAKKIIVGNDQNMFMPASFATRAEAAVITLRLIDLLS